MQISYELSFHRKKTRLVYYPRMSPNGQCGPIAAGHTEGRSLNKVHPARSLRIYALDRARRFGRNRRRARQYTENLRSLAAQ